MTESAPILELRDLVKTFPGVRALDGARFELKRGEVHALVGENGAGKSTMMNLIAGVYSPDSGALLLDGQPVAFANPHASSRAGIGIVFQELSLVPGLTVAENIFANRQPVRALSWIDSSRMTAAAKELLALFELTVSPGTLVKNLSVAQQQVVEILKAMSHQPRVLILDEPTSSLTAVEARLLFTNIRRLKAQGVSFIYISHHLGEIFEIADRVTVLRDGQTVDTCAVSEVTEEIVVRKMIGRELKNVYGVASVQPGAEYFRVQGAGRGTRFAGVSFALRRGEIVGLAGLVGAGRTELARGLAGIEPLTAGQVTLDGRLLQSRTPAEAIAAGIAYLTEDRKSQGLFLRADIRANSIAPGLARYANAFGFMREHAISAFAESCRQKFGIVTPGIRQRVLNLSGGNQQKVLLGMWVGVEPKVLIVDEPTRGVDIGAKAEIYQRLRELAATGIGILMISSEMEEVLGLSDRVLVMRDGRLVAELPREQITEENVIAAATGVGLN